MHIHCPTLASITRLCVFKLYFSNILNLIVFKMYYHSTLKMTLFTGNFVQFNLHSFVYHSVCIFQYAVCMTYLYLPESIPSSSVSFRALSLPVSATGFISFCQQPTPHPYLLVFLLPNLVLCCMERGWFLWIPWFLSNQLHFLAAKYSACFPVQCVKNIM